MHSYRLHFPRAGWLILLWLALPVTGRPQATSEPDKAKPKNGHPANGASTAEPQRLPPIELPFLPIPPVIDGSLDDTAWQVPPLPLGEWLTYNPSYGEEMAQKTEVRVGYDKNYLYFAFRSLDPEPGKIKTSIARRDTIWNDDWIGLSLDALGTGQSSYDLFVNPSGIQGDILTSSTAGENTAPDFVWDSAGKITSEGYNAEMRVPLKSIRFKSGAEVRMGALFWRRVSRLGMSASWPDLPRGKSIFTRHAPLLLHDLKQPLTLEAIPNFTYSFRQTRATPTDWGDADSKPDAGLTVKYGITSSVTLDGTIRPDFSQVESDAFQVEVNQRYPIFFSEKRPFFMEGMGTFELAGTGGDGNMRTAVHTRRIIDPLFGMKLTGSLGKFTFATLSASDRAPGQLDSSDPHSGERKSFNIARTFYSLRKGSYVGALFTDTEFGGGYNRVVAGDISLHVGEHQQWSATFIGSDTLAPDQAAGQKGVAAQMSYGYSSKRYEAGAQLEHYDPNFQMDTAFYNRTGITGGWAYAAINLYPDQERYKWFKRVNPFIFTRGYRDRVQGGNDRIVVGGLRMYFTRQGVFRVHLVRGREPWVQQMFEIRATEIQGSAQLFRWLNLQSNMSFSRSTFYDPVNPFPGNERFFYLSLTVQPNSRLNQLISFTRDAFDRLSNGERVYTVNIVNTRTSYQITKSFSVRAIAQYDSSRTRILTDFLGSYELMPGTVAYAGYGALFERRSWDGQQFLSGAGDYLITQRGLFFKVSYLYRF
jgi:hypothetical protein